MCSMAEQDAELFSSGPDGFDTGKGPDVASGAIRCLDQFASSLARFGPTDPSEGMPEYTFSTALAYATSRGVIFLLVW